jgi:predicted permease
MLHEIRYAFRMILRSPGFTAIAVLSLALGIGANAAIFSIADALLLRPLAVADPARVLDVSTSPPGQSVGGLSYPDYRDLRDQARSFDGMVAFQLSTFSMARSKADPAQMRMGMLVSDNFFSSLGVQPALGRSFLPEEASAKSANPTVVLGYGFWMDQFNSDRDVIGRTIRIAGIDFTVIGVAPKSFTGMDQFIRPAFFVPIVLAQSLNPAAKDPLEDRHSYNFSVEARLKPTVSRNAAQSELATLLSNLQREYPGPDRNRNVALRTQFQLRVASDPTSASLDLLLIALASIVLMIACANVANLLLGRSRGRSREIAVRIALGVSRNKLLRQLMTENLVLSLIGAAVGMIFAYGGIRFLQTIPVPTDLPIVIHPELDHRVLLVSLLAALMSVLFFGLAPALQSLKTELVSALKSGDAGQSGKKRTLGRDALVVGQIALAMVLLVASGMLMNGFRKTLIAGPGFRTDHLMMMETDTALVHYKPEQTVDFYRNLKERARELPGVTAVAMTSAIPLSVDVSSRPVIPEGHHFPRGQESEAVFSATIDENYLTAMAIPVVRGRNFSADDKSDTPRVAIVNEYFAQTYWPGQDPIGKRLQLKDSKGPWVQIVGIAKNSKYGFIGEADTRYFYLPFTQDPQTQMVLLAQTQGDAATLAAPLRSLVHSLDPNQPIFNARTVANFFEMRGIAPPRIIMQIITTLGLVGFTLALIGIYGLVSYSVSRRTREIGVRMAIGANKGNVIRLVLRQGLVLSLVGIGVGGVISVAVSKVIEAGLAGMAAPSATTYIAVPLAVLVVTMAACWAPAHRASRIDPIRALRLD